MASVNMDYSGPEQDNESQESLHLALEDTEIESLDCSDIDSTTITPVKKKKRHRSPGALRRVRVLRPLSQTSDAASESDSILNAKEKLVQSSRNKESEPEQTPSTSGKKSRVAVVRRSPRKKKSDERSILQDSDNDTDADTQSPPWAMSSTSALRRSPRKKTSKSSREASQRNVDNINKTPRGPQVPTQPENSSETVTPNRTLSKGIQGQLKEMQATQKEILSTIKVVRNEVRDLKREFEKRKEETKEIISVPNRIRNNVKEFYACGEDRELKWDFKKRYNDEANNEMTDFIKKSVKGVAPDVSNEVLDTAVKRYFTSKKEGATRKAKNKDLLHRQRQASYERKNEKLRRRLVATDRKKNWPEDKRASVKKFLSHKQSYKYMSSDEEAADGFISHPYSWESETWKHVKDSLDKKYLETCPPRSKRLVQKRTAGSTKEQEAPEHDEEFNWVFK
ncbi:uncharacterized protein LOC134241782 [Saccostrea cucullata]|uniref:uncharacterized protein LOC134241782 n=1 Tax=Saccostrea cuccullata TaxID=36930 RepID=UPI002ED55EDA